VTALAGFLEWLPEGRGLDLVRQGAEV